MRPFFVSTLFVLTSLTLVTAGCGSKGQHAEHADTSSTDTTVTVTDNPKFPPDAEHAEARLQASPRHGQYVMIPRHGQDSLRAWIVYPQRNTKAPVVVVVHEIFGLTTWVRAVADQLASEGFIAIAPDLLTGERIPGSPDSAAYRDQYVKAVSALKMKAVQSDLDATAKYAMALPAALPKYGIVGFCWGGGVAFAHAVHAPTLTAAVVFYGQSPDTATLDSVKAPVLGLYAGNDARVGMTVPPADSAMKARHKTFEHYTYDGAGHGFLRQQKGEDDANLNATKQAWPATIAWFRRYLEG
jgi:carboxymethylenebutenolidase